ncbi:sugar phosphorylase [Flavobacteriaceae bacterium M23B6Z8]
MKRFTKLKQLLNEVYPDDIDFIIKKVEELSIKYDSLIKNDDQNLSHKDAILITYADAIFHADEKPLQTLKTFFDQYLSNYISAIHLLPCFPFTSDDGFSVVDYYEINPEYGNWDSIAALNESADLMFDAVINHMSKSSEWFTLFQKNRYPYNEYFIEASPDEDYSKVVRPRALPLLHKFKKEEREVYLWTTFSEDQLDLNYRSPYVFLQVLDILLFYISKGSRYLRLDAIAFLWKEKGTSCIHLPQTHAIIQAYRAIIELLAPQAVLITETNVPHLENISYFGDGTNEAHMVYNFTLPPLLAYCIHKQEVSTFVDWARTLDLNNKTICFFNFTASHDGIGVRPLQGIIADEEIDFLAQKALDHGGFVSYKNNGDGTKSPYELNCNYFELLSNPEESFDIRIDKFMLTQAIMLTMPGVPGIYYHSILGSLNYRKGAEESGINRRINREKLEYNNVVKEISNKASLRSKVYHKYIKLLKIRINEHVFDPYGAAEYSVRNDVLIIERFHKNERLLAVFNLSVESKKIPLEIAEGLDLILDKKMKSVSTLQLGPWKFKWIKIKR